MYNFFFWIAYLITLYISRIIFDRHVASGAEGGAPPPFFSQQIFNYSGFAPPPPNTHFSGEHTRIESENEGKGILHVVTFSHPTHPHTVSGFENVTFFVCVFVCFKNYVTCLFDVLWSPVRRFIGGNMHGDTCKWYLDFFILYYTRDLLFMSQSDYTSYRAYSSRIHQII